MQCKNIAWAEMIFPPINLWSLANMPATDVRESMKTNEKQRRGDHRYRAATLMKHVQIQQILDMHRSKS